jgi:anti-sigma-K factor RskA
MTRDRMDLDQLRTIIDGHGPRLEDWPAAERQAAEALMADSAAARALLAEARALDRLLDTVPALSPTPALRTAILATAPRAPARPQAGQSLFGRLAEAATDLWRELGGWRLAGAALAASLVLGILAGGTLPTVQSDETSSDLLQLALLDDSYTGY